MNWTADFPILAADENGKRLVYLDSAATTQHPTQVLNAVVNYYNKENANPHRGVYELAMRATDAHEGARHTVAQFFNAEDDEIVFTQNTTESLNLIAYSYGMNFLHEGDEIVISVAEHHSNMVPWQRVAKATGAKLVYISSDYVFGGSGTQPLEIDAPKDPQNIYGTTKLGGEEEAKKCQKHFIVRTSWVFGINGGNFVKTMLRLADSHEKLTVVDDQTGSPTYTPDLARLICDMIKTEKYGTYHASNEGYCTWAEFAKEIMRQAGKATEIAPCTTAEYPAKAKRPENSRLSKKCLDDAGFDRLPPWQDALARFLKELDLA